MLALLLGCRNPVVHRIDEVAVPTSAEAPAIPDRAPRIGVTADGIFLDPTPWQPDGTPIRVMGLTDPQDHELALPALVAALEPVRDARPDDPLVPEVRIDAALPYRVAVRVLYSLSMAMSDGAWIGVRGGALRMYAPTYCGDGEGEGQCVMVAVDEEPGGLSIRFGSAPADHDGCTVQIGGRFLAGPDGGCPTVPQGGDLQAALERTRAWGPPCGSSALIAADDTPWGEVVARWVAMRKTHPYTLFGVRTDATPTCADPISAP